MPVLSANNWTTQYSCDLGERSFIHIEMQSTAAIVLRKYENTVQRLFLYPAH